MSFLTGLGGGGIPGSETGGASRDGEEPKAADDLCIIGIVVLVGLMASRVSPTGSDLTLAALASKNVVRGRSGVTSAVPSTLYDRNPPRLLTVDDRNGDPPVGLVLDLKE